MTRRILLIDIGSGLTLQGLIPSVALYGTQTGSVKASNGVPPYTYTLSAGVLPAGVYLDAGTGLFSGSPTEAGNFPITVKATDLSGASTQRAFTVKVIAEPLTLSGTAPDGTVGVAQSYTYTVAGGVPPYTFALVDAPDGWSIPDASTPTIDYTATSSGTKTWTVRATDAIGGQFDLADAAVITAPSLTLSGDFADATIGTPYSSDLAIAGGDGTYSNPRVTVGSLAGTGLVLSIVSSALRLSGTPTGSAGTLSITVAVDSGDGQTASSAQSINVSAAVSQAVWSSLNKASTIVLSNGGVTASGSNSIEQDGIVLSSSSKSGGKFYVEIVQNQATSNTASGFGLHAGTSNIGVQLGDDSVGWSSIIYGAGGNNRAAYHAGALQSVASISWHTGQTVRMAVDIDAGKLWLSYFGSSTWIGGGDPADGTSPTFSFTPGVDFYFAGGPRTNSALLDITNPSAWVYPAPADFGIWTA
ncbi:MAG: putative Ig domain-containing protein [Dyella sp.]|uniref:putative Ig domain-containing protein n=1 Tax=Dyella sp. TaxID=1869338 RepID=UPI003F7FB728